MSLSAWELRDQLKKHNAELVAVSKTQSVDRILQLYQEGQRHFGENRVQELVQKHEHLPSNIHWHLIGHLQKNKVKYIVPFVSLIHSIDSIDLIKEIEKQAAKNQRKISILLQFKIAQEASKFGINLDAADDFIHAFNSLKFTHIIVRGVMGMASFVEEQEQVRDEFRKLNSCFNFLKKKYFTSNDEFSIISMGMSGDYKIALEEGSNMVRIGSLIFGKRT